ncbi:MAG: hypothetical protein CM15mP55_2530 [Hyphomicrobiales bacterium]|nr:MAG: hypothetical protein CM15mP55_2530 [Hyphomicrobiales bacterium]
MEQAPKLGEVGAGIQIPPNAMKVFALWVWMRRWPRQPSGHWPLKHAWGVRGWNCFTFPGRARGQTLGRSISAYSPRRLYCSAGSALRAQSPDALQLVARLRTTAKPKTRLRCGWPTAANIRQCVDRADGIHSPVREQMRAQKSRYLPAISPGARLCLWRRWARMRRVRRRARGWGRASIV